MFRSSFRLPVRLLGIPIRLDTSFLLVLPIFAWLIGSQIPSYGAFLESFIDIDASGLQHGLTPYLLGLIAAIGLFASVLVHELGHAVIARLYGVEVQEITLWFLGGLAQFEELPKQRGAEAVVAVAGPVTSLILAALGFGASFLAATGLPSATIFVFSYLALTNLFLAVFNLLPALPLDGGRILRSLLALAMPNTRATRIAGAASRAVALLLVFIGIFRLDVFVLIVAFFIYGAVRAEVQNALIEELPTPRTVHDLMTTEVITVDPDMPLEQFAKLVYFQPHRGYPVVDGDDRVLGFAVVQDANEEEHPDDATVAAIVRPAELMLETDPATDALSRLNRSAVGRLVVVDQDDRIAGVLSRTDVLRELQQRSV